MILTRGGGCYPTIIVIDLVSQDVVSVGSPPGVFLRYDIPPQENTARYIDEHSKRFKNQCPFCPSLTDG